MISYKYEWPKGEDLVYLRPPNEQYNGKLANFYHSSCFPELDILKENWEAIRDEILEFEKQQGLLKGMDTTNHAGVIGNEWTLIYLQSFMRLFKKNRAKFPFTTSILDKIPNCVFSGISVLSPNTEIAPHYGDTNGIVRCHLALVVPAPNPEIAMQVGDEIQGWTEGEILCFINVQKHNVWNKTKQRRYVIMLDIVPDPLKHRQFEICVKGLGSQSYNYFYERSNLFRALPNSIHKLLVKVFTLIWRVYLPVQRKYIP